jgi:hypothetical protein
VDLYFFYDIDVAILVVEVFADDLVVAAGLERAVPAGPLLSHVLGTRRVRRPLPRKQVEWLSSEEKVLAVSDYEP